MVRTSSITTPSMVGIVDRAPAVDEKSVIFLSVFILFVTLWNNEVRDNGSSGYCLGLDQGQSGASI